MSSQKEYSSINYSQQSLNPVENERKILKFLLILLILSMSFTTFTLVRYLYSNNQQTNLFINKVSPSTVRLTTTPTLKASQKPKLYLGVEYLMTSKLPEGSVPLSYVPPSEVSKGAWVSKVIKDSPAYMAGIIPDDIITSIDGY